MSTALRQRPEPGLDETGRRVAEALAAVARAVDRHTAEMRRQRLDGRPDTVENICGQERVADAQQTCLDLVRALRQAQAAEALTMMAARQLAVPPPRTPLRAV